MDIITIFQSLLRWGIPALIGGTAFLLLLSGACFLYKKVFHGTKSLTKIQIAGMTLLCCWAILVIGLTSLSRGSNFRGSINIDFLGGYISAWNHWSISELQLILFNMLMFAPLGFLLPLVWKKAEKLWVTLAVSLAVTALIEVFQFFTGTGIFELDDLFHNLIGSLFGYFCIMAILLPLREKVFRFAPAARVLLIPCAIGLTLGAVFYAYDRQPYGNMSILPAAKQDMSQVRIITEWEPSRQNTAASVYKNKYAGDKTYIQRIKSQLAELEGLTFSKMTRREAENYVYTGTDANGSEFQENFFFRSGQWSYTTFAEEAAQLTEDSVSRLRARYESWMKEIDLLPESAEFSVQNGDTLRWDAVPTHDILSGTQAFQNGSVMIQFDEAGNMISFYYLISWNEFAAAENIISEKEAYAQVQQGNFEQYVPFEQGDTLHVTKCELTYLYDTKGFYQPVYQFSGYLNDRDHFWSCRIPALQK